MITTIISMCYGTFCYANAMINNDFILSCDLDDWSTRCVVMQYKSELKYKYFAGRLGGILKLDFFSNTTQKTPLFDEIKAFLMGKIG